MRLIDADAVEKQAYDDVHYHAELEDWEFDVVTHYLDHATTVDAVPVVHGRWEFDGSDFADIWKCSACGKDWYFEYDPRDAETPVKFCPDCGARMDGDGHA
jgi:DNA-directed RNA polymerase subunit RPC12/RpoP